MKHLVCLLLLVGLFSCQDLKEKKQLEKITSFEKRIDQVEFTFNQNKSDSIGKIVQSIMDVEFRIRRNYFSDTIDKALAVKVNAYKGTRKKLKGIGKYYTQIPKGVEEERLSLKNLKSDIENAAGEKAKYDEFITFEENKVKQLETLVEEMVKGQKECFDTYYQYHDELNAFSMSLLEKKKKK